MSSSVDTQAIAAAVDRARAEGRTSWIARVLAGSVVDDVLADPLRGFAAAGRDDRFFWEQVETGDVALATGLADEIESAGVDRFADVRSWAADVRARIDWVGADRAPASPTFFGGFGFEPESRGGDDWKAFPAARFVLPSLVVSRIGGEARAVLIARVESASTIESVGAALDAAERSLEALATHVAESPSQAVDLDGVWGGGPEYQVRSDRPHAVFCAQVEEALRAFDEGELEKVVLARSLSVDHDGPIDVPHFMGRLRELYPSCTLVAMGRGDDTFLAATPELLIRSCGAEVSTAALAGSAPRGRHPDEDRRLGEGLLASAKERAEHGHVVEAIRDVLAERTEALDVPETPVLRRLFGIQHLETPIQGRLRAEHRDVVALVEALHPTPAVGGVPARAARDWLRRVEGLDRGWYASPIGWLDLTGGGDFRVALRSALIRNGTGDDGRNSRSLLFAGAGIVSGSVPEQELGETRIKLRALLAPLTEI
ncbi:MAG: isochorismate synthase [Myxococcota bacterium]